MLRSGSVIRCASMSTRLDDSSLAICSPSACTMCPGSSWRTCTLTSSGRSSSSTSGASQPAATVRG
jgi:hypothetical protein